MPTTAILFGRNRGFRFRLLCEPNEKGRMCINLHITSPTGKHTSVRVLELQLQMLEYLSAVFKLDLADPDIDPEEAGRRLVETIAKAVVAEPNTVSKYLGKLLSKIMDAATAAFPGEVREMPELVSRVKYGDNRGHRLNVDLIIDVKAEPGSGPHAPPQVSQEPVGEDPKPEPQTPPREPMLDSKELSSELECEPPLPQAARDKPTSEINVLPLPLPLEPEPNGEGTNSSKRSAQAEEKAWSGDASDRTNDRNRTDNSGHTPA